jgi:hypothetical protein
MKQILALILFVTIVPMAFPGSVVLKKSWVKRYKDRATIDATFTVDHAHKNPNNAAKDGDEHVAGRSPKEIGLPLVAEVVNAAQPFGTPALTLVHSAESSGQSVSVSGAWRLWFEHPADSQTQFATFPKATNTNPDHSFEIHPMTKFDGVDLTKTFVPIPGFAPHDAEKAFTSYEKQTLSIQSTQTAVTLTAKKSSYNYVQFTMRMLGKPKRLDDGGYAVLADVEGTTDEAAAEKVRMIFVPGTPPCTRVSSGKMGAGDEMEVIGIPRVNLNAVWTIISAPGSKQKTTKLPYELIIVAIK